MIKANAGAAMRRKFPFLNKVYWSVNSIWSIGYFVSILGLNEEPIGRDVQKQDEEDSGQVKLEF